MEDFSGLDKFLDRAGHVFNRHGGIDSVLVVKIDVVRPETLERFFDDTPDASLAIGPYIFRPAARMLHDRRGDRRSRLTDKEVAILKHLYRAEAKVVDREMLLREVWGYATGITTHTLETHIYRLRQKMELDPTKPAMLLTEYRGYRLDPTVGNDDDDRGGT